MTKERLWKLSPVLLFLVLVYLTYSGFNESSVRTLQLAVITTAPGSSWCQSFPLKPCNPDHGCGDCIWHVPPHRVIGDAPSNDW